MKKNVNLNIRIEKELREAFKDKCLKQDIAPSKVLRHMMKSYVMEDVKSTTASYPF